MCLWLKYELQRHLCAHLISHVISLLVSASPPFRSTTTRSTTWTARPSPRRHCTPSTSSGTYTVDKQRQRTALARQLRECQKPATPLPQVMSPKSLRQSGSSLEDICQLHDVHKEFGEQDQQAPVIEEGKDFGQIEKHTFLDHEMAAISLIDKMSYLQSRMHFDDSMKSNAGSDLEDGEIRKLLTSSLYAQRAQVQWPSGKVR